MTSILRQIVAGPRSRHPEANLDLCYVTDNIIATSGPSITYPSLAYRNPLSDLVAFLDSKHGDQWCLFEFRAEGCGYPDESVYGRIWHWPWPDHHPPPFALVPKIMGSINAWLNPTTTADTTNSSATQNKRVAVVHCKAGKGRSGSMAVSYMITHLGWDKTQALQRFTDQRMRPGFGLGVSIPSQRRWIDYVERWATYGQRVYVERSIEIKEVHVWGLRDGVRISIEGYIDSGKKIKEFHLFTPKERQDIDHPEALKSDSNQLYRPFLTVAMTEALRRQKAKFTGKESSNASSKASSINDQKEDGTHQKEALNIVPGTANVIFRPSTPIILPTSDVNLAVERSTLTSIAHAWFNCYFEGQGPEHYQEAAKSSNMSDNMADQVPGSPWADSSGVFTIDWDAMDGLKGSSRKGMRAFERVDIVWFAVESSSAEVDEAHLEASTNPTSRTRGDSQIIVEPKLGDTISPVEAADWRGVETKINNAQDLAKHNTPVPSSDLKGSEQLTELRPQEDVDEDGAEGLRHGLPVDQASSN